MNYLVKVHLKSYPDIKRSNSNSLILVIRLHLGDQNHEEHRVRDPWFLCTLNVAIVLSVFR